MTRILISGATGLVGNAIYQLLKNKDLYEIVCISSKPEIDGNFIHCDLSNQNVGLDKLCNSCDIIIHCAAVLPNNISSQESGAKTRLIDKNIYDYAYKTSTPVIYISSAYLYDLSKNSYKTEDDTLCKHSDYHSAKIDGEVLFGELGNTVIARISSPYGRNMKSGNVLNIFTSAVKTGQDIKIQGTGNRLQDFIHVKDIAAFVHKALGSWKPGVYNIAYGKPCTMLDLAMTCIDIKAGSEIRFSDLKEEEKAYYPLFSNKKALDIFGWLPNICLCEGLKDIIND